MLDGCKQPICLRFHLPPPDDLHATGKMAKMLRSVEPHILVRKLDDEEDRFITIQIAISGAVTAMSNDQAFAHTFLAGILVECAHVFHADDELELHEEWIDDSQIRAMFLGMLTDGRGWDSGHNIPENIRESLEEAQISIEIENYRSCVVMCRRTLEGVLKFGFPRLLGRLATDRRRRELMLNAMIKEFRNESSQPMPQHLLHIVDSVRLIGNVPGAHASEIEGHRFSHNDAAFVLHGTTNFLHQYFSKIDAEVNQYYTVTIDLNEPESG